MVPECRVGSREFIQYLLSSVVYQVGLSRFLDVNIFITAWI